MSLRVSNIRLGLDQPEAILSEKLAGILRIPADLLGRWRILRKSLDARDKEHIGFVYSVEVSLADEEAKVGGMLSRPRNSRREGEANARGPRKHGMRAGREAQVELY